MQLKFYARGDAMCAVPGTTAYTGQVSRYIGRDTVIADAGTPNEAVSYPANKDGFACDSDSDVGRRAVKLTRRDLALWPADEATAAACGVAFVKVEFKDGTFTERATAKGKDS